jgi:hypothetical protein
MSRIEFEGKKSTYFVEKLKILKKKESPIKTRMDFPAGK